MCSGAYNYYIQLNYIYMNSVKEGSENVRNRQLRLQCIDYATRVVGKPEHLFIKDEWVKKQEDVVAVASKIYDFVEGQ